MLFSSYQFIFLFLPLVLAGYFAIGSWRSDAALAWLTICSLVFYAAWRAANLAILAPSVAINFALIRLILSKREAQPGLARIAFWFGIVFNLCFLGYFKYSGFVVEVVNDTTGASLLWGSIILPLGISFITFQKIALLVDVQAGAVTSVSLRDYALFVLFFPQLISGPIVHFRELMPQFAAARIRPHAEDAAVGLTLFFGGLFKKVALADPMAALVNPFWAEAAAGGHPALLQAWAAALGYMLQLYFDFSGYSDMAIGAARLFGIKLPPNFDSPLKAVNVIEYWSRWHMTLTRFLTSYVFTPLTYKLMRGRIDRGLAIKRRRRMTAATFATVVAYPTVLTMFLSGVWHGAGYQFLVFGLLHGAALTINHAWRAYKPAWWPASGPRALAASLAGWAVTFLFVVCAEVFFRASSVGSAGRVLAGMTGVHGVSLPAVLVPKAAPLLARLGVHVAGADWGGNDFVQVWAWIASGLAIVLLLPNTLEMLAAYEPAFGFTPRAATAPRLRWAPSPAWAVAWSGVTVAGCLSLGRLSDFLYWHF